MSLPLLTIIPAGAGSGKTHEIQKLLCEWVSSRDRLVRPERIAAVTFTEAAAAELRDRIRAELVNQRLTEDALKLDQAYISTIHSFGLRLITEFAFEAEMSPQPRLLNDDEKDILIRLSLARTDKTKTAHILNDLTAFGYIYDGNTGKTPEDRFRDAVLGLVERLRSIGRFDQDPSLVPTALKIIEKRYGPVQSAAMLTSELQQAVSNLLKAFPHDLSGNYDKKSVSDDLKKNFRDFKKAQNTEALNRDWPLWQRLRDLRISNKQTKMPPGYDELALAVMDAASALPSHPGPLLHAKVHAEALLSASQDILVQYSTDKREKGLVDYSDMVAIAQKLLTGNKDVIAELRKRIDCLVIDEFQDTNPLQFSLLWALHEAKIPTLVVGDLKQAIMGFQNADPRLLEQLQKQNKKDSAPLTANWRSSAQLMKWINRVGAGLFSKDYTSLEPKAGFASSLEPLEVISFPQRPAYGRATIPAQYAALRLKELLDDPFCAIYDRHLGKARRLRGGDIAVLCPTNKKLRVYADALNQLGIRTRIEEDGWFESRIIQIAYHALSYTADPGDVHAAFYLAVTELGSHELESALKMIVQGKNPEEPFLERLKAVSEGSKDKTIESLTIEIIEAMDLFGAVSTWPDASQARANLLRLLGEAKEFMGANREALASGGFYGSGIKTFFAWLNKKMEVNNSIPASRSTDEDAIQLATWHKSKGKEWPVVAVCGTDSIAGVSLPHTAVEYEDFSDLRNIIKKAKIVISPAFDAPETADRFLAPLQERKQQDALRLLYVALTRAREKVILEWHGHLGAKEGDSYWNILQRTTAMELRENTLAMGKDEFKCIERMCGKDAPASFGDAMTELVEPLPIIGRRAIKPGKPPEKLTSEFVTPSMLHVEEAKLVLPVTTEAYGTGLVFDPGVSEVARGTFLHRCAEVMGTVKADRKMISRATGHDFTEEDFIDVQGAMFAFEDWVKRRFNPVAVLREAPLLALNSGNSVVSGMIDLIIETDEGIWILDHKSDQVKDIQQRFAYYLPQLMAYADGVRQARKDKQVIGVAINWMSLGKTSVAKLMAS